MKSTLFPIVLFAFLFTKHSDQASINDKKEPDNILDYLNSLDRARIIEVGNKLQKLNKDVKNVDFEKLISIDDQYLFPNKNNKQLPNPNQNKLFSFQNVLQQASSIINSAVQKPNNDKPSSRPLQSLSQLASSANLTVPLAISSSIQNGLLSANNLTGLSLNQLGSVLSNNDLVQNLVQNQRTTQKPSKVPGLSLDQVINIINNLNPKDGSRDKMNKVLVTLLKESTINQTVESVPVPLNYTDIIANLTDNNSQLTSLLAQLPSLINTLSLDPNQLNNIISSLQVADPNQLTNDIINVLANQTNLDVVQFQSSFQAINQLTNLIANLNATNLMGLLQNLQSLELENSTQFDSYIEMVSNQTSLTKDQVKSVLSLLSKLLNLGQNANPQQIFALVSEFLQSFPDISASLFNYLGVQMNLPPEQFQSIFNVVPALIDAATTMNYTQLASLVINFAAQTNMNLTQADLELFQNISDAISKMDFMQLFRMLLDLVTTNQNAASYLSSQLSVPPEQLNSIFTLIYQLFNTNNETSINQVQSLVQDLLTKNPELVNQFVASVSAQTGMDPQQVQAAVYQLNQVVSYFVENFINQTGDPIGLLNVMGFFNSTGLTPEQFQSILSVLSQLFNTNSITPEQIYTVLNNYQYNNQTLLSILISYLAVQTNLTENQIQNIIVSLPSFLNFASNSNNSSQILTLLTYLIYQNQPPQAALDPSQTQNIIEQYSQLLSAAATMSPQEFVNFLSSPNASYSEEIANQLRLLIQQVSPNINVTEIRDVKILLAILIEEAEKMINSQIIALGIPLNIQNQVPSSTSAMTSVKSTTKRAPIDSNLLANIQNLSQLNLNQVLPSLPSRKPSRPANDLNFV